MDAQRHEIMPVGSGRTSLRTGSHSHNAPTSKKRPTVTFARRTATPAAIAAARNVYANPLPFNASYNSSSGNGVTKKKPTRCGRASDERKRPDGWRAGNNNEEGATATQADDLDPEEVARLEKKRRQNTQVARRSRIRKAEEVQKLQNRVADLEAEVIAANSVSLMRNVMQLDSICPITMKWNSQVLSRTLFSTWLEIRRVARPLGKRLDAGVPSPCLRHLLRQA
jgi:hypothetical protein